MGHALSNIIPSMIPDAAMASGSTVSPPNLYET